MAFDTKGAVNGATSGASTGGAVGGGWGAAAGAIGGALIGGFFGNKSEKDSTAAQIAYNKWALKKTIEHQEYMSNTAHRREMEDLRAAGLNPLLTINGGNGATSPTVSALPTQKSNRGEIIQNAINTAVSSAMQIKQINNIERKTNAEINNLNAQTRVINQEEKIKYAQAIMENQKIPYNERLILAQISLMNSEATANQMNAETNRMNAETNKTDAMAGKILNTAIALGASFVGLGRLGGIKGIKELFKGPNKIGFK